MSRTEQVNALLHREIAQAIRREIVAPDVLITVTGVACSPDLREARVWLSVLPDNRAGSTLAQVRKEQGLIYEYLKKTVQLRRIPVLTFVFDDTEKKAAAVRDAIDEAHGDEQGMPGDDVENSPA